MSTTLADLESWISDMMKKQEIAHYKMDVSGNTTKGDGYLGEVTFIKIIASAEKGGEKYYNLIVKSAKKSDEFRKQTPIREAFEREIFMYTKVFPIFLCAVKTKKESLILENLKTEGFEIHDRKIVQNLNHALFVFRNYGKFHAISLALKSKKPALYKSLTKNMTNVMGRFISQSKMITNFINDVKSAIDILRNSGREALALKFEGFEDGIEDYLINYANPNNRQSVITHGDCWNNNMMFKYEDENKNQPIDIRFIDFQLSTVASPVFDLSYYLYCCTDETVLRNFNFLLQAYYSSLSDSLKEFGCNPEELFTFKELKDHWTKYGRYGFCLTPFILKIALCETDEVVDFADTIDKGELSSAFDFKLQRQDLYKQRLVDVLTHFAETFL
ncbi:hypothetical protein NQ314_006469 [Rhamnusium bicolor]|uniref:CHK kinase-like domain-containing protein n=1 Tax=Rhamnusium bicolor TaxID=1586634 RepID=A0AAV8Z3Q0_9CUCU|nr:hypothetical protein NQ314_006469 [Rhamnusium bicolor]